MRPVIILAHIRERALCQVVFEAIAEPKHYKVVYAIQNSENTNVYGAIGELLNVKEFADKAIKWCNDDANYRKCINLLLENKIEDICDEEIPLRNCDYKVGDHSRVTYFWIKERVEIDVSDIAVRIARLHVDEKSNLLLWNDYDEDDWSHYTEDSVYGIAYKEWLAERELLK